MKTSKFFWAISTLVVSTGLLCEAATYSNEAVVRKWAAEIKRLDSELEKAFAAWSEAEQDFGPNGDLKRASARLESARLEKDLAVAWLRKAEARQMVYGDTISPRRYARVREAEDRLREAQMEYDSASQTVAQRAASQSQISAVNAPNSISDCQSNLAYLSGKLYRYGDRDLVAARDAVLGTNIREVIATFKAQGLTTSQASKLLLEQAKEYDRTLESARTAVYAAASDQYKAILVATLKAIDSNQALPSGAPPLDRGMTGLAVKEYILAHWGRLANREVAIQVACHAANGF